MRKILFTRGITNVQKNYAFSLGLRIVDIPFIKIVPKRLTDKEVQIMEDLRWENWIFTSQNAVKAIHSNITERHYIKNIFCVGKKTSELLREKGFSTINFAYDAENLSDLLREMKTDNILYFSGNLRRNILTDYFLKENINYQIINVYLTYSLKKAIDNSEYDGICFCSPSAVIGFLSKNKLPHIPVFVIGNTTAKAIEKYTKDYYIANETSINSIIEKASKIIKP